MDCAIYGSLVPNCIDGEVYSVIQYVWKMEVEYEKLEDALLTSGNYSNLDQINFSDTQWAGDKPKDNVVLGVDFNWTPKNDNVRINSSIALSLYNENIWDGGVTLEQLDALDGYEDCFK